MRMKEYFLNTGEMKDIPGYKEDKQTMIDEGQINHIFDPANGVFSELKEIGDWIFDFISDLGTQVIGHFSNSF